jgi:hypothetical protein
MATWGEVAEQAPELAAGVRASFDQHKHKILATLRRDGSPRVSGIETEFRDGEMLLGMMPGSRKALDLRRDPRMALHGPSLADADDPAAGPGDAKVSGRAVEVADPDGEPPAEGDLPATWFRVDVREVVLTRVHESLTHLVIDVWRDGEGVRSFRRE